MEIELTPELERKTLELSDLFKKCNRLESELLNVPMNTRARMYLLIEIANAQGKINYGLEMFPAEVFMSMTEKSGDR
jgi:hypothetical protein